MVKYQHICGICCIVAAVSGPAGPLSAAQWRDWTPSPDSPVSASFVPAADTRWRDFSRLCGVEGYASIYQASPFIGEIRIDSKDGGNPFLQAGELTLRVEAAPVAKKHFASPSLPPGGSFPTNPHLPFGVPTGEAAAPVFTTTTIFPADVEFPLSASFHIPHECAHSLSSSNEELIRVRWTLSGENGKVLAKGVLTDAFDGSIYQRRLKYEHYNRPYVLLATQECPDAENAAYAIATEATARSWPFLSQCINRIVFDEAGAKAFFAASAHGFADRAILFGIGTDFPNESAKAAAPQSRAIVAAAMPSYKNYNDSYSFSDSGAMDHFTPLASQAPNSGCRYYDGTPVPQPGMDAATIPGDLIGRNSRGMTAATVLFILLSLAGTAAVVIRCFAFRKGEARMLAWRALPLWSIFAAAFALVVLPLITDRGPRSDVTEWRLSVAGAGEELRISHGRASSFGPAQATWSFPESGWFSKYDFDEGGKAIHDLAAGTQALTGKPRQRGNREEVLAMRFAPALEPSFALAPADGKGDAGVPTDEGLRGIIQSWAQSQTSAPTCLPNVSVKANADFAGVWLFRYGKWFGLGPMARGEEKTVTAAMHIGGSQQCKAPYTGNLFGSAPVMTRCKAIQSAAEKWIEQTRGGAAAPEFPGELRDCLDDIVIVALRAEENPHVELSASYPGLRRTKAASRIVEVEVHP